MTVPIFLLTTVR